MDNPNNLLVRNYIEWVKANKECKVFVLENVGGILTAGNGRFKEEIYEALSDFHIESGLLCSAGFSDPQERERAIIIGSRIGPIKLPEPFLKPNEYRTVKDALSGISDQTPNQMDVSTHKPITLDRIKAVPIGGNIHDIPQTIRPSGQHSNMYLRMNPSLSAKTIVNPRKAMLLHPYEDRSLSVRECARLQGLDDDFIFKGDLSSKQEQVANGVPLGLGKGIAGVVKAAFEKVVKVVKKVAVPALKTEQNGQMCLF